MEVKTGGNRDAVDGAAAGTAPLRVGDDSARRSTRAPSPQIAVRRVKARRDGALAAGSDQGSTPGGGDAGHAAP